MASIQPGWRWCDKCQGLWYSGAGAPNVCVDKQGHQLAGSASYVLAFEDAASPDTAGYQQHWAWCRKCGVLFYHGPEQPSSACPADGGLHDASGSGNYVLSVGVTTPASGAVAGLSAQSGWLWCDKCQELYYGPNQSNSRCPKDGRPHDNAGSGNYTLSYTSATVEDQVQNSHTGTTTGLTPWQSFTANVTGLMCQLDVFCGSGLDPNQLQAGTIKVYAGEGINGQLLVTQPFTFRNSNGYVIWQQCQFATLFPVIAGQKYTFELTIATVTSAWVGLAPGSNYQRGISYIPGQVLVFHTWVAS